MLLGRGWSVRGTSRSSDRLQAIVAAGIEPAVADPDRVGSIVELLGDITVLAWLPGGAIGDAEMLETVNGERLGSLLEKLVDTPVRGLVYETQSTHSGLAGGGADPGAPLVADAARRWQIPTRLVDADRTDPSRWAAEVADAVEKVLGL